ncbi:hypothetical protein ACUOCP_52290, partial [Escherichia sp. R-CC3]
SNAYKSSRTTMLLSTPDGRQALQQARLQATTGHAEEAVASYNKLFNGAPPEGDIAVEYWSTVAKIPARHSFFCMTGRRLQSCLLQCLTT